jgi:E3 ubiquitin-protein ligase BOI-like protein
MFLCVNRNGKEKEHSNFTLQSQAAGDFLDQTNMLFNNGSSNQRKRRRETNNHQLLPMQSHQFPQVIDLSLLHNYNHPPSNMVHTGLRLFSGEDQAQKISHLSEDVFAAHINRQSEELDEFLHAQVLISYETIWVTQKF